MSHPSLVSHLVGSALVIGALLAGGPVPAHAQAGDSSHPLAGTSWQLVRFQGGDDTVLTPVDRTGYTLTFDPAGNGVAMRVDCNRGRGTWSASGRSGLQFGPMALTRAMCPQGSMHDQLVKQWGNIRSFVLRDGRLFLSLMADGGIYEFEPMGAAQSTFQSPVTPRGPTTWTCGRAGAGAEPLRVTHYATTPALVLLERGGVTRPAFQVVAASGARYEGDGILFWEARGEATLNWLGTESTCRPS
jgi:heat shock protein HslJ/membrane-bound inhibitor of C-type lysozyme